tara:strand:+ start:136 stop:618 length:483 start_codon:yes stop_codon:yes gene_type:complete
MFRIRLLILLLVSFIILSCAKNNINDNKTSFSLGYIGGNYDGVILNNLLKSHLKSNGLYDPNSHFKINANAEHTGNIYITNIDNTSDREKITSVIYISIINKNLNCTPYKFNDKISQFYIFSPNSNFMSNDRAKDRIKFDNTESIVKKFINDISYLNIEC